MNIFHWLFQVVFALSAVSVGIAPQVRMAAKGQMPEPPLGGQVQPPDGLKPVPVIPGPPGPGLEVPSLPLPDAVCPVPDPPTPMVSLKMRVVECSPAGQ